MAAASLVEVRGLRKRYGYYPALDGIDLDIREGEVFGYVGPNGAGKTTTLKVMAGLIAKFEGSVAIAGVQVTQDRSETHALIGYLPQSAGFQSWRTVESALRSLGALSRVPASVVEQRMGELLERFQLAHARGRKIRQLSGGMTQKLGLIQALLHRPRLLILDEPLEGLDPASRGLLKEVIRERQRDGATVLFSSHILGDVQDVADRVGVLCDGRMVTTGSIRDLVAEVDLPLEIGVEFSTAPSQTAFLGEGPALAGATEVRRGVWSVRLRDGTGPAAADEAIHALVERTLQHGGRLRRIAAAEPNLDQLFARLIERARAAGRPS
jgi:ABC-2 type transport system ATP-binding protein